MIVLLLDGELWRNMRRSRITQFSVTPKQQGAEHLLDPPDAPVRKDRHIMSCWYYGQTGSPSGPEPAFEPTLIVHVRLVLACVAVAVQPVAEPVNVSETPDEPVGAV